ncbi:MFS transporter [Asanoa sp. NPDC049573]|uniref:MFS transporter n=1 Tax=Asanoa sp. NPDC049573 TaxID=3155396 RepID=UPI00341A41AA
MFQVLRLRDFRLLFAARVVSQLGSWLLLIAVPAHVFALAGSLMAAGLTLAAEFVPVLLLGQLAGVFVDRWDRRTVMVAADLGRAAAVALLLFARHPDQVWIVYVALAAESTGSLFFRPAAQAHTPIVVGTGRDLTAANSLNTLTDGVMRLVGGPLGAALLVLLGFPALVLIDVASYLLSGLTIVLMSRVAAVAERSAASVRQIAADLREGLRAVRRAPVARGLLPITVLFVASNAALSALLVPFGVTHWGGQEAVGFVVSALGVGFLLGAPALRLLAGRTQPRALLAAALATTCAGFYLLFGAETLAGALPAAVLVGTVGPIILVLPASTLQRVIPNAVLGRVSAVFFSGEAVAMLAGAVAGPLVAGHGGVLTITIASCTTVAVAAVLCLLLVPPVSLPTAVEPSPA